MAIKEPTAPTTLADFADGPLEDVLFDWRAPGCGQEGRSGGLGEVFPAFMLRVAEACAQRSNVMQ